VEIESTQSIRDIYSTTYATNCIPRKIANSTDIFATMAFIPDDDYGWSSFHIPDLQVKHNKLTFKYDGCRLNYRGHGYHENLESFFPRIALTKAGKVAKRQVIPPKQPVDWWKAQCAFRGLNSTGTIQELQNHLKAHPNAQRMQGLTDLEATIAMEYKQKREAAQRAAKLEQDAKDAEALSQTKKFLQAQFPAGHDPGKAIVVDGGSHFDLHGVASSLGLRTREIGVFKLCIIIGSATAREEAEKKRKEAEKKRKEIEARKAQRKYESVVKASGTEKNWVDVTGVYQIKCAEIEEQWPDDIDRDGMKLRIQCVTTKKGPQMYAEFDFGVLKGAFRFERQDNEKPITKPVKKTGDKRKREAYDEAGEADKDDYDGYGGPRSPTPEAFYLGSTQMPSVKRPTWNYRWRGREAGENVIDLSADEKAYSLTFSGPGGTLLTGTFGASVLETCKFTGKKISMSDEPMDIGEIWADHNERAYSRECCRRWGGWY
jgi:hypothetical protein